MRLPELVQVNAEWPTHLLLTYADGQVRRFDCTPYLNKGVFVRLKERPLFLQAHVAHGTVCWPGGLDIAPETLWLRSSQVAPTPRTASVD